MSLLKLRSERAGGQITSHRTICCPYNGHQVSWCMGFCQPDGTIGHCGRLAPHAMKGRAQRAIENYFAKHGAVV